MLLGLIDILNSVFMMVSLLPPTPQLATHPPTYLPSHPSPCYDGLKLIHAANLKVSYVNVNNITAWLYRH